MINKIVTLKNYQSKEILVLNQGIRVIETSDGYAVFHNTDPFKIFTISSAISRTAAQRQAKDTAWALLESLTP